MHINIQAHHSEIAFTAVCFYIFTFGLLANVDYSLLVLAIATIILTSSAQQETELTFFNYYIVSFLTSIVISNYFGVNPSRSASLILTVLPSLLLYYLIGNYLSQKHIYSLYSAFTFLSLTISTYLLTIAISYNHDTPTYWITKAELTFLKVPNSIFFLVLLSPLTAILLKSKTKTLKILSIMDLCFILVLTIVYQSRSALLVIVISMIALSFFLIPIKKVFIALIGLSALVILVDTVSGFALLTKILTYPWTTRFPLWLAAYYMFLTSPLIGNGGGSYVLLYRQSLEQHQALELLNQDPRLTPWAHNLYLEVLAEHGLIGFVLLLALLGFYFKKSFNLIKKSNHNKYPAICIFIALLSFCTTAIFELSLWHQWVFMLLFTFFATIDRLNNFNSPHNY
jgi:O-antigen ligase